MEASGRVVARVAEPVTAEAQQYRLRVEAAEKERDEQLALTAELKATTDKQIEQLQTAKCVLEEEKATVLRAETARTEEAAKLRLQLIEAQRTAERAVEKARLAEVDKVSQVAAEAAKAQSLQLQLSAAEEEMSKAKHRTELRHSEDMQALSKSKEELQKQLEGACAEVDAAKAAKDSVEKELVEIKKTEKQLRRAGGDWKEKYLEASKLLEEERAAKALLEDELAAARDAGVGHAPTISAARATSRRSTARISSVRPSWPRSRRSLTPCSPARPSRHFRCRRSKSRRSPSLRLLPRAHMHAGIVHMMTICKVSRPCMSTIATLDTEAATAVSLHVPVLEHIHASFTRGRTRIPLKPARNCSQVVVRRL